MTEYSRRALLLGGAAGLGVAGAAAAIALGHRTPPPPVATPPGSPSAPPPATPVPPPPPPRPPVRFGAPTQVASIVPRTSGSVLQQVELTSAGEVFATQSRGGTAPGRYTTVISRSLATAVSSTANPELDAMVVVDGGHGMGLHVEPRDGGGYDVWTSLQGAAQQSDPDGGLLARFAYTPGEFTIDAVPGGVALLPRFPDDAGRVQESVYAFDWAMGLAVERMFDFGTGRAERYTRRLISDVVAGVDRPLGRMTLPVNAPTLQGFATVGESLFRWVGRGNGGSGSAVAEDPMAMEEFDWGSGARLGITPFPTLGQDGGAWRGGAYEPEGCSVHRWPDGSTSLVVGVTVGAYGDRAWPVYRLDVVAP